MQRLARRTKAKTRMKKKKWETKGKMHFYGYSEAMAKIKEEKWKEKMRTMHLLTMPWRGISEATSFKQYAIWLAIKNCKSFCPSPHIANFSASKWWRRVAVAVRNYRMHRLPLLRDCGRNFDDCTQRTTCHKNLRKTILVIPTRRWITTEKQNQRINRCIFT